MTITAKIGRIGFTERGAWVDTIDNYMVNDLVHHNNGIWRCIIEGTRREPSNITPDWVLWVQGLSNTNASGISFNPAATHLTATSMQTATEQLARAATTTVQGLGRTATPQEIQDRAYAGNIPAYVTAANLPVIPTNRATATVFGQVRLATQEEVNNRITVGNTPAVVVPEQIPAILNFAPSEEYIDVTFPLTGAFTVAPFDGFVCVNIEMNSSDRLILNVYKVGATMIPANYLYGATTVQPAVGAGAAIVLPVSKGMGVNPNYGSSISKKYFRFIKATKGAV